MALVQFQFTIMTLAESESVGRSWCECEPKASRCPSCNRSTVDLCGRSIREFCKTENGKRVWCLQKYADARVVSASHAPVTALDLFNLLIW